MNNGKLKRALSVFLTSAMLLSAAPVFAASGYLTDIGFDDAATNDQSEFVTVEGSSSGRVVEDGAMNKSYMVECGNVDNIVQVFLPELETDDKYIVQFDMRIEGASAEGKITLSNPQGTAFEVFTMDDGGKLRTSDNRSLGSINSSRMRTVSIALDNNSLTQSAGLDGNLDYYRQNMDVALPNVSTIEIATYATLGETKLYLDNIRVYSGESYRNEPSRTLYNSEALEYIETDESGLANKVYYRNALDSSSSMTMTKLAKRNTIEWLEEGDGGFVRMTKSTSDDAMIDMTISASSKRVIAECDVRFSKNAPETLFYFRDNSGATQINFAPVTISGDTITAQGSSMQLRKNVWYTISVALDVAKHTFAVYVDGELLAKDKTFNEDFANVSVWRMYVGGTALGAIDVDNLAFYGGTEPRDIENDEFTAVSRFSDTAALNFLRGKRAVQLYGSTAFFGSEKTELEHETVERNDERLLDVSTFETFFDTSVSVSGDSITAGNAKMAVGSNMLSVGGKEYTLSASPEIIDGILYLPAREYGLYANVSGFIDDGHGMIAIGSNIDSADARLKQANIYLYFDRKPASELKEQFLAATDNGTKHPRLIATEEDFTRLKGEVQSDELKSKWYKSVIATADSILEQDVLEYVINDGRLLDVANSALSRLEYLGFAYQMTGDTKYAERGIAEMEALCAFPDWHPDHYLDTGTLASAVAIGFDWLYDAMTEEQRDLIAEKAQEYALDTAKMAYYSSATFNDFWADTETNWGIICNGGIANLALAIGEYNTDENMEILANALRSIEIPWYRIAPDGAWYEGPSYWGYLLTHLTLFMSSYKTAMCEPFGEDYMGMDKYAYFQAYFQDPDGLPNNFHDSDETTCENAGQFYMASIYDDPSLMLFRAEQMEQFNVTPGIFDILWCKAGLKDETSSIELENEKYFRETEFVAMREDWDREDSAWLSFHGGYSNNAHDHIDNGTFVYNIGGVRWAIDLGRDMLSYVSDNENPAILAGYDSKYFYRRKGEGHNLVVINPSDGLEQDVSAFAQVNEPVSGTTGAYATIELSDAYAANADSYVRGYLLTDNRRTFTVRDEIVLKDNSELHWFMHTKGDIRIVDNNTAIIYQDGKQLLMQFASSAENTELKAAAAAPMPQTPVFTNTENIDSSKIDYTVNASGKVTITVKMSLLNETGSESGVYDTDIADWDTLINVPADTGEISYGEGRLSGIYADGELVKDFDPERFIYTVSRSEDGTAPEITLGEGDSAKTESFTLYDGTEAMVFNVADANGNETSYVVKILEYDNTNIDVYNTYSMTAVEASSEQIEEGINNIKEHSCDNNYETRWSANGIGEWCIYDLGEEKEIDAFAVAFWMGSQRQFRFEVQVSNDGRNFTSVMTGTSPGNTEDVTVYVPDSPVSARYIKLIGNGNSTNEWNNVIEFMALEKK